MNVDPLSDVLRCVRLRGGVYFYVTCRDNWVAESPSASETTQAVIPGAENVVAYHLIAKGDGWATIDGEPPVRVGAGDIVMFPRGDVHVLSRAPGMRAPQQIEDQAPPNREALPVPISYRNSICLSGVDMPADESDAVVVCGFIGCDLRPFNPLIGALPRLIHMPAKEVGAWVAPMLTQAVAESRGRRHGSAAVLERLSEMVFVDTARRYLELLPEGHGAGWLAALRDRHVGRAIALLHERVAEPWTVESLGREVGLSRSALHERFVELIGEPPMHYLANWRMQVGAKALRDGHATVATIAQETGYESEAAFARAFKRLVGLPPAAWRRAQQRDAAAAQPELRTRDQAGATLG
ncbi:AraC family transcriptional regulator [Piscinibacter sakaiensis]|uniref:AraC family transcriptional regulator n=1 Tax=Piscinibacter sakaiensis TaxID=1547922 RepID=UPI003AAE383C